MSREAAKPRSREAAKPRRNHAEREGAHEFCGTCVKCLQRATCGTSHSTVPFFASSRLRVRPRTGERWWSAWLLWGRFRVY
ncbi:MAG: hypothetical protein ACK5L2_02465, partial [Planctomyces sp.]